MFVGSCERTEIDRRKDFSTLFADFLVVGVATGAVWRRSVDEKIEAIGMRLSCGGPVVLTRCGKFSKPGKNRVIVISRESRLAILSELPSIKMSSNETKRVYFETRFSLCLSISMFLFLISMKKKMEKIIREENFYFVSSR